MKIQAEETTDFFRLFIEDKRQKSIKNKNIKKNLDKQMNNLIEAYILSCILEKTIPLNKFIHEIEKKIIKYIMELTLGNQRISANVLGSKPTTLNEKIKKFNLTINKSNSDTQETKQLIGVKQLIKLKEKSF